MYRGRGVGKYGASDRLPRRRETPEAFAKRLYDDWRIAYLGQQIEVFSAWLLAQTLPVDFLTWHLAFRAEGWENKFGAFVDNEHVGRIKGRAAWRRKRAALDSGEQPALES